MPAFDYCQPHKSQTAIENQSGSESHCLTTFKVAH
jgi:hypothetical protein